MAYCGRAVNGESPALIFPNGFQPAEHVLGAHLVKPGPLYLMRDPLDVLKAHEGGIDNALAFLTEVLIPQQLEILSSLMDERKCESVEIT